MDFFDKFDKSKGGYIFLSHSHDDIIKVRVIRNALEERGFEPLCFYLKCLEDKKEIEDLIKREIDAREWFVFVDSENSRKSDWVTLEREYIEKTDSKKIISVNINDEIAVNDTIEKLVHNLRVFMSYSHRDTSIAKKIKNRLANKDYLVFDDADIPIGADWVEATAAAITDAAKDGCVLALITKNAVNSKAVNNEIAFAIEQKGNVIPVILGNVEIRPSLQFYLSKTQVYNLPENPTDEEIDKMIDKIGQAIIK